MSAHMHRLLSLDSILGHQQPEENGLTRRLDLCKLDVEDLTERFPSLGKPARALFLGNVNHGTAFTKERAYTVDMIRVDGPSLELIFTDDHGLKHHSQSVGLVTVPLDELTEEMKQLSVDFIFSMEDVRRDLFEHHRRRVHSRTAALVLAYRSFMNNLSEGEVKLLLTPTYEGSIRLTPGDIVNGLPYLNGAHGAPLGAYAIVLSVNPEHPWLTSYNHSTHKGALEDADCIVATIEEERGVPNMRIFAANKARLNPIVDETSIGVFRNPYGMQPVANDFKEPLEHAPDIMKAWIQGKADSRFKTVDLSRWGID